MLNKGVSQESDVQNVAATAAYAGGVSNGATWHPKYKWWDEGRIEGTVNRQFVLSHLLPHGIQQLDQHLSFGDGLTDDTYMDWINQRAKIIFLILVDLGVPDQIFGVIDDSWDDNDLPIPLDQVSRLRLTHEKDPKFERRFYQRQFTYLLRYIQFGDSLFYTDDEAVPLVVADKHPIVGLRNNNIDKVYPVNNPENILLRQKILLGQGSGEMRQEEFLAGIEEQKPIKHKHIVTIWASYIHQDGGYILLTPINEGTLKSFLKVMPPAIKVMAKRDRRVLFLNWLHCLASALAFLHRQGFSHHKIKPSNVMMDGDGKIFLNNSDLLSPHQATDTKRYFDKESYDYAAPEKWSERPIATPKRSDMLFVHPQTCNAPPPGMRRISMFPDQPAIISSTSLSSFKTETMYTTPSQSPRPDPQKSDIFSLGCVFLDIVTVFMKRRPFSSLRSALGKTAGVGGGPPDSSYHKNLEQVYIWIGILAKDASKNEDKIFRSVSHILQLVTRMLSLNPSNRPGAQFVRSRLEDILTKVGGIEDVCCSAKTDHIKPSPWSLSSGIASPGIPNIEGQVPQYHQRSRSYVTTENEHSSINTRRSSWDGGNRNEAQPGEGKTSMNTGMAIGTVKPKPRAWQVPVYAG
jgi:serine/threonine protein kinase